MLAIIILIVGVVLILVIRHFNYIHSIEKDVEKRKREIEAKALLDTQDLQKRLQELEKELQEKNILRAGYDWQNGWIEIEKILLIDNK